jgi:hypothetical protein
MNIQNGDKFLFEPKKVYANNRSHLYIVSGVENNYFRLKEGIRDLGGGYTMQDVARWFNFDRWNVTYFPAVTKSVSEILDECQDI